jgi:DNA-binding response OmpR family regulator
MENSARPWAGTDADGEPHWDYAGGADRLALASVLVVEDDRDIRDMLTTLLDMAGFAVVPCDTAEAGLTALREQAFDVILTDYALPGHTGLWLLEQAEAEGLIQDAPVLIVTAHPNVAGVGGYEVIEKPFDLDDLVERIRYRVEGEGPRRRRAASTPAPHDGDGATRDRDCPVELILYVSSRSPQSLAAVQQVKKVLSRLPASRVKLNVHDLSLDPAPDGAISPGTIVRRTPGPRTFIMGHIRNPEILLELLADCETDQN